jgi:multiple sugar transport system permease protein
LRHYTRYAYVFALPAAVLISLTLLMPMLYGLEISFMRVGVDLKQTWTGLANYGAAIASPDVWMATWHTLAFSVVSTCAALLAGLGLALLLDQPQVRMRSFWRVLFLMPWTISLVAAGLTWKWIFDSLFGVANDLLLRLGLIEEPLVWLGTRALAMPCIIVANVWRAYPFLMILLLAALQAIPTDQYEAAETDGASPWQRFFYVTLPNLRYPIFVGTLIDFIFNVRQFDITYIMTNGGPRSSTEVLATLVNREAFEYFDYGSAAATSVLMLALLLAVTLLYRRLLAAVEAS